MLFILAGRPQAEKPAGEYPSGEYPSGEHSSREHSSGEQSNPTVGRRWIVQFQPKMPHTTSSAIPPAEAGGYFNSSLEHQPDPSPCEPQLTTVAPFHLSRMHEHSLLIPLLALRWTSS